MFMMSFSTSLFVVVKIEIIGFKKHKQHCAHIVYNVDDH